MKTGHGCMLKVKPFKQCCCKCRYLLKDYSHPTTDGNECTHLRGYVCAAFMADHGVHSGWTKHSIGCELYEKVQSEDFTEVKPAIRKLDIGDESMFIGPVPNSPKATKPKGGSGK